MYNILYEIASPQGWSSSCIVIDNDRASLNV